MSLSVRLILIYTSLQLISFGLVYFVSETKAFVFSLMLGSIVIGSVAIALVTRNQLSVLTAIKQGLDFFRDGEFGIALKKKENLPHSDLIDLYNTTATSLRADRQYLLHRELLFESVIESADLCMVLTDDNYRVFYFNKQAANLFGENYLTDNSNLLDLATELSPALGQIVENNSSGLITIKQEADLHTYHISTGKFVVNDESHYLHLLKEITDQLAVKEVEIWKKAIRVISHELNNSLAPITSMAQAGTTILEKQRYDALPKVFTTIYDNARRLSEFVESYANYAKLPMPHKEPVKWADFILPLRSSYSFELKYPLPDEQGYFDPVQMERVLLNILKNAHESGSDKSQIRIAVQQSSASVKIIIEDRGMGMSQDVLQNALLPFYSTKVSGTGVGLALCNEIVKAHSGHLSLANRDKNGTRITIELPSVAASD